MFLKQFSHRSLVDSWLWHLPYFHWLLHWLFLLFKHCNYYNLFVCHSKHVEIMGWFWRISSPLPHLCSFWGSRLDHQDSVASTFTTEPLCEPHLFLLNTLHSKLLLLFFFLFLVKSDLVWLIFQFSWADGQLTWHPQSVPFIANQQKKNTNG